MTSSTTIPESDPPPFPLRSRSPPESCPHAAATRRPHNTQCTLLLSSPLVQLGLATPMNTKRLQVLLGHLFLFRKEPLEHVNGHSESLFSLRVAVF